jgi:D-sedoheptulose 7-phosphate isomerase
MSIDAKGLLSQISFSERYKAEVVSAVESIDPAEVEEVIQLLRDARANGRNVLICADTKSACNAARILAEMMTRSGFEKAERFRVRALLGGTQDPDNKFEAETTGGGLVEEMRTFAGAGDAILAITASQPSRDLTRALEYAKRLGGHTAAIVGLDDGRLGVILDRTIHVSSTHLGTIEDAHLMICHMIGTYFLEFDQSTAQVAG